MRKEILQRFLSAQDRLVFQSSDLSLGSISSMVMKEAIDIAPSYQRRERWQAPKQSALIESFLLNVPVPPVYLAEDEFGRYSVVDGKQRITAIWRFMTNDLVLSRLETFHELEGLRFDDLPRDLQNALDVRPYLRVVTLLKQSDPELKFEVFTRLNKGGEAMSPQELRNVAFRGELNDLVYELSEQPFLRNALKIKNERSSAYRNMLDAELVLRFLTMLYRWSEFSGDYRIEMDRFMIQYRHAPRGILNEFSNEFEEAIGLCEAIWGRAAFKRPAAHGWRDQLLTGLYDAEMVAVSLLTAKRKAVAVRNRKTIIQRTRQLFENDNVFDTAVRVGTNTPARVEYRINCIFDILNED
jgi:hypothetical protein